MRITLGNIDGKALGLNASEACVYAAIEKCSRGDNAKGWYGTMEALASVLPFKVGRVTVSRAIAKLLTLGIIRVSEEKLFANVQNEQNNVQNEHENIQNEHKNVQNELPPNNPPINKENKMERENSCTHTPTRDAANPTPIYEHSFEDFLDLFTEHCNSYTPIGRQLAKEQWDQSSLVKRQALCEAMIADEWSKPRPDWCISDFPEPEPKDYNGARLLPNEPLVIAKYNDRAGLYTRREAELFGMNILRPFIP